MSLAIDSSTPAIAGATNVVTITSNSFSPPANSLLAIFLNLNGTSPTATGFAMTDSLGSHLTYVNPVATTLSTNHAYAQVWLAQVGASAPGSMTVTASWTNATLYDNSIAVVVFTGAASNQTGAATGSNSATSAAAPTVSLTTTQSNSWVVSCLSNYTNHTAPTIPGGQTDIFNGNTLFSGVDDSCWVQANTATTPSSGTVVTLSDTAPSIDYAMVALEILPGGTLNTSSVSGTATFTGAIPLQINKLLLG